jgi:hypothetical protein
LWVAGVEVATIARFVEVMRDPRSNAEQDHGGGDVDHRQRVAIRAVEGGRGLDCGRRGSDEEVAAGEEQRDRAPRGGAHSSMVARLAAGDVA